MDVCGHGHLVCIECISNRPNLVFQCPLCRLEPRARQYNAPPIGSGAAPSPATAATTAAAAAKPQAPMEIDDIVCGECGSGDDEKYMVLCDNCPNGYHTYCLRPRLNNIPTGDW
eukprot:COSAG05_NODE_155_length_15704_cov_84.777315_11_plen_114_part_00